MLSRWSDADVFTVAAGMAILSDIGSTFTAFNRAYGRPVLLALLLHGMLLAAVLQTRFSPTTKQTQSEPVLSYLYQPTLPVQAGIPAPMAENTSAPDAMQPGLTNQHQTSALDARQPAATPALAEPLLQQQVETATKGSAELVTAPVRTGLAQRALNRAATTSPDVLQQAATAGYQQQLQAQQQPKITVEKRHQALSSDPARQVVAQLADGRQLIRTKGGCRVADPSKQGFDALMAANAVVPCGDEDDSSTSALLKQALEKHIKR